MDKITQLVKHAARRAAWGKVVILTTTERMDIVRRAIIDYGSDGETRGYPGRIEVALLGDDGRVFSRYSGSRFTFLGLDYGVRGRLRDFESLVSRCRRVSYGPPVGCALINSDGVVVWMVGAAEDDEWPDLAPSLLSRYHVEPAVAALLVATDTELFAELRRRGAGRSPLLPYLVDRMRACFDEAATHTAREKEMVREILGDEGLARLAVAEDRTPEQLLRDGDAHWPDGTPYAPAHPGGRPCPECKPEPPATPTAVGVNKMHEDLGAGVAEQPACPKCGTALFAAVMDGRCPTCAFVASFSTKE